MQPRMMYITAGSREEAVRIGRTLVEERLVACANVIDNVTSIYWWDGAVQDEPEVVLIAKTTAEKADAVIARVQELHSYECPCAVAVPIESGPAAYLQWIAAETRTDTTRDESAQ